MPREKLLKYEGEKTLEWKQSGRPWAEKGWLEQHSYHASLNFGWVEATEHGDIRR
jgi:hypothetical protein